MDDDARDKALLDAVAKIPPTWTCIRCGTEFDNTPDGEAPWARQHHYDKARRTIIWGNICRKCYERSIQS